jgi:putative flippase GtrA
MIRQLGRFASVGMAATILHVVVAIAASQLGLPPQAANAAGFATALGLSYVGHGRFTFGTELEHHRHGPRFLATAGLGLALSSGLTQVIAVWIGAPFAVAMGVVALAVPVATFLLCRIWVFAPPQPDGP